jgi:sodium/pantothenate symporter
MYMGIRLIKAEKSRLIMVKPDMAGVHPIVPTMITGLCAFIIGSLVKPRKDVNHSSMPINEKS